MVEKYRFGNNTDGTEVTAYRISDGEGSCVTLLDRGATVQSICLSREGGPVDVALGYDTVEGYENGSSLFGAFVGRYANRIKNAAFPLGGKMVRLRPNAGAHHLHGAFARRVFDGEMTDGGVVFRYVSPPEEEGYPGTLTGEVRYTLTGTTRS